MNQTLLQAIKLILTITIPFIKDLIASKVVPMIKRKAYQKLSKKADRIIEDLAQNATKIAEEDNDLKKEAYIEGTKLGIQTLRAVADKLNKAANEIEKAIK
jgi:hypothetical protein